ncbi:hypothetical protein BH23PLA1_BH23PLA1_04150 [soil metagenome]
MVSLFDLQLQILRLMRDATAVGIITWETSASDSDLYSTTSGPIQSWIEFKWPSYHGAVGSDRDFVEVGGAGRFMIGTPGWLLSLEILAAAFEEWGEHEVKHREQLERRVCILSAAIEAAGA